MTRRGYHLDGSPAQVDAVTVMQPFRNPPRPRPVRRAIEPGGQRTADLAGRDLRLRIFLRTLRVTPRELSVHTVDGIELPVVPHVDAHTCIEEQRPRIPRDQVSDCLFGLVPHSIRRLEDAIRRVHTEKSAYQAQRRALICRASASTRRTGQRMLVSSYLASLHSAVTDGEKASESLLKLELPPEDSESIDKPKWLRAVGATTSELIRLVTLLGAIAGIWVSIQGLLDKSKADRETAETNLTIAREKSASDQQIAGLNLQIAKQQLDAHEKEYEFQANLHEEDQKQSATEFDREQSAKDAQQLTMLINDILSKTSTTEG